MSAKETDLISPASIRFDRLYCLKNALTISDSATCSVFFEICQFFTPYMGSYGETVDSRHSLLAQSALVADQAQKLTGCRFQTGARAV